MTSPPDKKRSILLVLTLWCAGLGAAMQFAKISVSFPAVQQHYAGAGAEIGLLVSIIGFLGIGLGLFAGLIVARIGFRRLLLSALVLGAVMSLYQATLPPFVPMLLSRIIEGASHLVIVVAAPTLIAQSSSDRYRGMAMTLWSTFFGVAFALVAWLGLPLVASHGLGSLFITHAIFLLVVAVALILQLPPQRTLAKDSLNLSLPEILRAHVQTYSSPRAAAPAFGWLFYTLTYVSLLTVLPDIVPEADRNFAARTMPIASITVSMLCGIFILPHLSAIRTIILGFVLAIGVTLFLWLGDEKALACVALMGVLGLVQSSSFAAIPQLNASAEAQARANGAMAQMGNLGNTMGTPLLLALLASFGFKGMIWGMLGCYCTAIGLHVLMARKRRSTASDL